VIHVQNGPVDLTFAEKIARLQARAYAGTGMRCWNADEIVSILHNPCMRLYFTYEGDPQNIELKSFLLASFVMDEAEILSIAVSGDLRRRGIASKLIAHMTHDCEREDIDCIILEVAETNEAALSLYLTLTFTKVGHRPRYYTLNDTAIDAYLLKRQIKSVCVSI
jgi:ribosomal protein S18 acetylase RimI-like enzyme